MAAMELSANSTQLENDGYSTVLSFADDPAESKDFVILQMVNVPSPQDVKLHLDGVHLEVSGHSCEGHGLVNDIQVSKVGVLLFLNEDAAKKAGLDKTLLMKLPTLLVGGVPVEQAIEPFQKRINSRSS
jgi:hypothetical protein